MKSRSAHRVANVATTVIAVLGLLIVGFLIYARSSGKNPIEAAKQTLLADRVTLHEPRASIGISYSGDRLLVITGWLENIGRNKIEDAELVVELLDEKGRVCQSGPLKRRSQAGVLHRESQAIDVEVFHPGARTRIEWVRPLSVISANWGGGSVLEEAERIGVHNNNSSFHAMMAGLGVAPDDPNDLITQDGVRIDKWVRLRVRH